MKNIKQICQCGPPPKDGRDYLVFGNHIEQQDCLTTVTAFVEIVHFADGMWLDPRGLSIVSTVEDALHFHNHIGLQSIPKEYGEDMADKVVALFRHHRE